MAIRLSTLLTLVLAVGCLGVYGNAHLPDECPTAIIACSERPETGTKYRCYATYHVVADHPVELQWSVSHGKLLRTQPYEIFIDARHVKAKTIVVTLKAHWKDLSVCDKTTTNTIELP